MLVRICKESDKITIQQQLPREFFIYICCLIGQETTTNSDKMHLSDLHKTCYVAFGKYLADGGRSFILNTTAILHQLMPANSWPEGVLSSLEKFTTKEFNLATKEARKIIGAESYIGRGNSLMRGNEIWNTFKAAQKSANIYNSSWGKLKSGENKSGLLYQIRESLWPREERQKNIKRIQTRALSKKFDNDEAKAAWITSETDAANRNIAAFNPKWFPSGWLAFVYLGYPSGCCRLEFTCFNPPQKEEVAIEMKKAYEELGKTGKNLLFIF